MGQEIQCCTANVFQDSKDSATTNLDDEAKEKETSIKTTKIGERDPRSERRKSSRRSRPPSIASPFLTPTSSLLAVPLDDYTESILSTAVKTVNNYNNKYVLNQGGLQDNHGRNESIPNLTIMINGLPSPTYGNSHFDFQNKPRPHEERKKQKEQNPFSIQKMMGIPKENIKKPLIQKQANGDLTLLIKPVTQKKGANSENIQNNTLFHPARKKKLAKISLFDKILVPKQDEDAYNDILQQHLEKLVQEMASASLLYPVKDDLKSYWKNRSHVIEWKDSYLDQVMTTDTEYDSGNDDEEYSSTSMCSEDEEYGLTSAAEDDISVTTDDYAEIESSINNSDYMMSILAFQGIGCHYTKLLKHDDADIDSEDGDNISTSSSDDEFLSEEDDVSIIEHNNDYYSEGRHQKFIQDLETKLNSGQEHKDNRSDSSNSNRNNIYVADFTFLQEYEVRDGFMKYGAAAYFNDACQITSIYVSHFGELYYPPKQRSSNRFLKYNDSKKKNGNNNKWEEKENKYQQSIKQWEIAKEIWKMSLFVSICIRDNITWNHLIESNHLLTNIREILPPNHCIRRLLKIFTFRTGFVNYSITTALLPKGALFHRIFAFKHESLKQFIIDSIDEYRYKSFLKRYDECLAKNFNDSIFGFDKDCKDYYKVIKTMVTLYTNRYYEDFEKMKEDESLMFFWKELLKSLKVNDKLIEKHTTKFSDWVDVITTMICNLTAVHNQVGHGLTAYMIQKPQLIQPRMTINNPLTYKIQPYSIFMIFNILSSVTKSPSIKGQFDHLLLHTKDDRTDKKLKKLFDLFRKDLKELQKNIEARNKDRRMNVNYMNPRFIRCSQSI